ncbi:hypothetical protein PAMP_016175 [Pampus punctatissimus]
MEYFVSLWWKEYLNHITSPLPVTQPSQDSEKTQIQEAKKPFRENLDSSISLLSHFPLPSERLHPPAEPQTCPHAGNTLLEDESKTLERTEVQDSSLGAEGNNATDTDTHPMAADAEMEHRRLWEAGQADYLGRDAFQNIQRMLDRFLD